MTLARLKWTDKPYCSNQLPPYQLDLHYTKKIERAITYVENLHLQNPSMFKKKKIPFLLEVINKTSAVISAC